MKIPTNNRWTQFNKGDVFGVLNTTRNVTLDRSGAIKLGKKMVVHGSDVTGDGGDVDFEQVHKIVNFKGKTYAVTDDHVFNGEFDGSFFADTASDDLDVQTGAVACYGRLYVVDGSTVDYYDGTTWTSGVITGLDTTTGNIHAMEVFDSLATYKLAIADKNSVRTYDSSHVANGTVLTLPDQYVITSLVYRSGYLYVGTKTDDSNEAKVFIWDGATANANYSVPMSASWVFSMIPYKNTVAGITNEGELFSISGTSRIFLGALPIYYEQNKRWYSANASSTPVVLSGGMSSLGDNIYINVEADLSGNSFLQSMIDGLWCYDPEVGLYHYASPTTDPVVSDNSLSLSSNELTTSADHKLMTGDPVTFNLLSGISGISNKKIYYAIVTGSDTLSLAGNRYDADQGNVITITGTPSTDTIYYAQNADTGCLLGSNGGAVATINHRISGSLEIFLSDLVFGSEPVNTSNTSESVILAGCDSWNIGWFATQKIFSQDISKSWDKVTIFFKGALLSNEKIIVKYRTEERVGMPTENVNITWSDADTFTTTDPNAANNLQKEDEVIFLAGSGQGRTAHITSVSVAGGTTTVNIDESIGTTSATGTVTFTNYKKAQEIISTSPNQTKGYERIKIEGNSPWVQIKVEMRGYGIEVYNLDVT